MKKTKKIAAKKRQIKSIERSDKPLPLCDCGHTIEEHGNSRTGACDQCKCGCFDDDERYAASRFKV